MTRKILNTEKFVKKAAKDANDAWHKSLARHLRKAARKVEQRKLGRAVDIIRQVHADLVLGRKG
jgi:hypothetical protein